MTAIRYSVLCAIIGALISCGPMPDSSSRSGATLRQFKESEKIARTSTSGIQTVLRLTNNERKKRGLSPLRLNRQLSLAAKRHSIYMSKNRYLGHKEPNGGVNRLLDRVENTGYEAAHYGENVFGPDASLPFDMRVLKASDSVKWWMNSGPHRKNILKRQFTDIGIATYKGYWTQVFGTPR